MTDLFSPMPMPRGNPMKNRFMLAPLTNMQSHPDGVMSEDEFNWLTMRAHGGFGMTMTCAAHVNAMGQGFPGQLGVWDDKHLPGLSRLAETINATGSRSSVQLHHAGRRSPKDLINDTPVCAFDDPEETGARALTTAEAEQAAEDYILAGIRAEKAGFDGVEIHGAHGYLLGQFFDAENNNRTDKYGGNYENRTRMLWEIIDGLRSRTAPDFQIGVRISPERFGIDTGDALKLAEEIMASGKFDYLDMSLWDCFKEPEDDRFKGKSLVQLFADLPRGGTPLGAAGKLMTGHDIRQAMDTGLDFVILGRAAILHHNFPKLLEANPHFHSIERPVTRDHLRAEGLGEAFVDYMASWPGTVSD